MKRFITLISIIAVLLLASPGFTYAENSDLKMTVKGSNVQFSAGKPFIENGRSLFPLRDLLVALGVANDEQHIIWDGAKQSVTAILGETKIELFVGKKEFYKNGQISSILDVAAENVGGRIYLPARVVAEAFGFHIDFDANAGAVLITEPSSNDNQIVEALAMDKTQLFEKLVGQYDYKSPSAQTNLDTIKYIKQYLVSDLPKLVEYSFSVSESEEKGYAVNQILDAMPDDVNFKMLTEILEKHPNPDVRYNVGYIMSKFNKEAVFNAFTKDLAIEKNYSLFGNAVSVAVNLAGINADKIVLVFDKYNALTDSLKSEYNLTLISAFERNKELKSAWTSFLATKVNGGIDSDKKNANEITDYVLNGKKIPPPEGSIDDTLQKYMDSFQNKDIDAYVNSQVTVTESDKQETIQRYLDYNYRYLLVSHELTSKGNSAKGKIVFLVQIVNKSVKPNIVSSHDQVEYNATLIRDKNWNWKISSLEKLSTTHVPINKNTTIYVE